MIRRMEILVFVVFLLILSVANASLLPPQRQHFLADKLHRTSPNYKATFSMDVRSPWKQILSARDAYKLQKQERVMKTQQLPNLPPLNIPINSLPSAGFKPIPLPPPEAFRMRLNPPEFNHIIKRNSGGSV